MRPGVIAIYRGRTAKGKLGAPKVFAFRDPVPGEWYAEARIGSDYRAVQFGRVCEPAWLSSPTPAMCSATT